MKKKVWNNIKSLLSVFLITFVLVTWVILPVTISGSSMYPNLENNERGFSFKLFKDNFDRFDIVVLDSSHGLIVKRVIAFEGETVEVKDNQLLINNTVIEQPFLNNEYAQNATQPFTENYGPIIVPKGHIFVMGDNRPNSLDSRSPRFGTFEKSQIVSKGVIILWPLDKIKVIGF